MSPQNNVGRAAAGMGAAEMTLRGFDEYEVTLGDEMRGERASLGVSLADVEQDLRIKAGTILAIENADANGFPNTSVIPGYVRSYARYLGMEPEQAYRRFCAESGFRSASSGGISAKRGRRVVAGRGGANLTESRFAPPPAPSRIGSRVSLGAVASSLALVALVGGLGFGGRYLLQDIQKVGLAPLPATADIVEAPVVELPRIDVAAVKRPDVSAYEENGILASAATDELPPQQLTQRDGPIADIDPNHAGVFAATAKPKAMPQGATMTDAGAETEFAPGGWNDGIVLASLSAKQMMVDAPTDSELLTMSAGASTSESMPEAQPVSIHATGEAWVRVKDANGTVVFEGILAAGDSFVLPAGMAAPELRAGNAGDVYVTIGDTVYGPVGKPGRVVKNVALDVETVRGKLALAEGVVTQDETVQSAEAALPAR